MAASLQKKGDAIMSVSPIRSVEHAPPVHNTQAPPKTQRAADGDYLTAGVGRSAVKDADGDYKPTTTAAKTSNSVQAAVSNLKRG